jgi:hypothetical protein
LVILGDEASLATRDRIGVSLLPIHAGPGLDARQASRTTLVPAKDGVVRRVSQPGAIVPGYLCCSGLVASHTDCCDDARGIVTGERNDEEMMYGVCDADSMHPDRWLVVPGVDYVAGHLAAREIAARLASALRVAMPGAVSEVRPDVCADGSPMVWVGFDGETAEQLAVVVERLPRRSGRVA